jgi:hypothetical protein
MKPNGTAARPDPAVVLVPLTRDERNGLYEIVRDLRAYGWHVYADRIQQIVEDYDRQAGDRVLR